MRDQYAKLVEFADRDNIMIQVLPFNAEFHPATARAFAIMEFHEPYDPNVVHPENMTSILYAAHCHAHWYAG
ncbi:Scr1 family TA system antitoxin-like transcriptional regulator [Streptosporangium sp. CA-115845]|uniref:Scr1 family TA system antitoxin-like transcriptional regulator n=1 Tax=Streptosporangium sp. CA-115845 TaxID=3240071 RepID=UPI003D90AC9D